MENFHIRFISFFLFLLFDDRFFMTLKISLLHEVYSFIEYTNKTIVSTVKVLLSMILVLNVFLHSRGIALQLQQPITINHLNLP